MNSLGDAPLDPRCVAEMNKLGRELDRRLNGADRDRDRKTGFVMLVFPFGAKGRCDIISNGIYRADIVALFREIIARLEGKPKDERESVRCC